MTNVQESFIHGEEEHNFTGVETKASGMFGLFSGEGNGRVKTDRLEEKMRHNGWRFELEGAVSVPKSLDVYVVDLRSFQVTGSFSGLLEEGQRGVIVYQEQFSTARTLDPSKPIVPEPWSEVADLRHKVDELLKVRIQSGTIENSISTPGWKLHLVPQPRAGHFDARYFDSKVTFPTPFSTKPDVIVGLSGLDCSHPINDYHPHDATGTRIRVTVTGVDEKEFTYRVTTWSDSVVTTTWIWWVAYVRDPGSRPSY